MSCLAEEIATPGEGQIRALVTVCGLGNRKDDVFSEILTAEGIAPYPASVRFLDFLDPWGNRVQVVEYRDIQFAKTPAVLKYMGLDLKKSEEAKAELRKKAAKYAKEPYSPSSPIASTGQASTAS